MRPENLIIYQLAVSGTLLFFAIVVVFIYAVILFRKRRDEEAMKQRQQLLEIKNNALKLLAAEQELAANEVKADLHREILPLIMFARMNLHEVEALSTPGQIEYIKILIEVVETLTKKIKDYGYLVDVEYLSAKGVCSILENEAEQIRLGGTMQCSLDITGNEALLSPEKQVMVYRIAKECIQNTLMYSQASQLKIRLEFKEDKFEMNIIDDGIGFDAEVVEDAETAGIMAMRNRADLLGGKLTVNAAPMRGTHIILTLPYEREDIGQV